MPFSQTSLCQPAEVFDAPPMDGLATIENASAKEVIDSLSALLAPSPRPAFLSHFAYALQRALAVDYFVVSRLNPYSNIMRSMRFVADGTLAANVSYSLDNTPCARAVEQGVCIYPDNVAALYPRDRFLVDKGISGYAGAAMKDRAGNAMGVMLALRRKPIENADAARAVLEHFRIRVACAIDTGELIERTDWALAEATEGVWDWDVVTGGTTLSPSLLALFGYSNRALLDLTHVERAIHPDDRARHAQALRDHLDKGTPLKLAIRLKTADGAWRWHLSRGKAMHNEKGRAVRMIGCFIDVDDLFAQDARLAAHA